MKHNEKVAKLVKAREVIRVKQKELRSRRFANDRDKERATDALLAALQEVDRQLIRLKLPRWRRLLTFWRDWR